jgi:hypothetical protein
MLLGFSRCEMIFPDFADPGVLALASESLVDVRCGSLTAEFLRQGFTGFDDLLVGIDGGARHGFVLLLLPFAGGTWVRSRKRKNKLSNFFT